MGGITEGNRLGESHFATVGEIISEHDHQVKEGNEESGPGQSYTTPS